jgi:hypothetical protein
MLVQAEASILDLEEVYTLVPGVGFTRALEGACMPAPVEGCMQVPVAAYMRDPGVGSMEVQVVEFTGAHHQMTKTLIGVRGDHASREQPAITG